MLRSIRFRLTLWYTAIVLSTFIFAAWGVIGYVTSTLSNGLDQSITSETRWSAARYEKFLRGRENVGEVREQIFDHVAYYPIKEFVEIWDSTGAIFYQTPNLEGDTLRNYVLASLEQSGPLRTITDFRGFEIRMSEQKMLGGVVLIAMPMENITLPLDHLFRILLWLGPLVVLISVVGGMTLAKKSFSKVNQLIETAKRITADRLNDRIPEHDVPDEIGRLTSTFNQMIARLDQSFQRVRQFTSDASHELRTPLSVMRSQLESALDSRVNAGDLRKIAAHCLDQTMHMSTIVENLLLLTKADEGKEMLRRETVDLSLLVRQTYEESIILASPKKIAVTLEHLDKIKIIGDEQRLRQLLLNLIDNAIKHSHEHGHITMGLRASESSAQISIEDDGLGIPEEDLPKIFDRFYRADRSRTRISGGAGLGLAISKWIVEAHGGQIFVQSELNKGSVFTILLPAGRPQ